MKLYEDKRNSAPPPSHGENLTHQTPLDAHDFIVAHYGDYSIWLTTFGRKTSKPRLVQIWFAFVNDHLYVFSRGGLGSQWAKNVLKNDRVIVNLAGRALPGRARLLEDDDMRDEIYKYYRAKYRLLPQTYIFSWKRRMLFEIELEELVATHI
jgi:deazaflavin-dependent oxidoreductase (nitroreductase family)